MIADQLFLQNKVARELYKNYAEKAPIFDFHCHLSAQDIYEDKIFDNISHLWLGHDHYKWRAMRIAGVDEFYITGDASPLEKFKTYAKVCARLAGSPLYLWSHLELKNYFGITEILNEHNAQATYDRCNTIINEQQIRPSVLIAKSNVHLICTTDDPADNLEWHTKIAKQSRPGLNVLPTFRPDHALNIQLEAFIEYIQKLGAACQTTIVSYTDLLDCLRQRVGFFAQTGCLLSDHSLENMSFPATTQQESAAVFNKRLNGETLSIEEVAAYRFWTLQQLAAEYKEHKMVMQLHVGALRNVSSQMYDRLGPDVGFDIMNDFGVAAPLTTLLNTLQMADSLPATLLYSLNSKDNLVLSSLPHCFQNGKTPGYVQFGAAWWFNDHRDGILEYFKATAAQSMLAQSVGMLTDSRSFLSYTRHDYFRRLLCQYIGQLVEAGEFDPDEVILQEIIEGICYKNVERFLGLQ
jgi:glucuronate isomerase